jgi:hypothetical protein
LFNKTAGRQRYVFHLRAPHPTNLLNAFGLFARVRQIGGGQA